jgi:hypothetical protein
MFAMNTDLLFIVEPARLDTYELLCRNYSDESGIRVILDRRESDRRDRTSAIDVERRRGQLPARRQIPCTGDGYIVVERGPV